MALTPYYRGPATDHFDGQRFFNPGHPDTDRRILDLLKWRLGERGAPWPKALPSRTVIPDSRIDGLRITMIGHASVLVQATGANILIDPVWSDRASPVSFAGPRRATAPGIRFEDLPPIDAVLLTHNHYDHFDLPTLRRLWARHQPQIIAPIGNDAVLAASAPEIAVETADWRQIVRIGADIGAWLHPAHHWSARGVGDRRMALWSGFVIETRAGRAYIAGDTGYGDGQIFREIKARFDSIDVAVIPIGAYEPRWFMKDQHVNPEEAVQIMIDCGARQALGVHWGCFRLTGEPRTAPRDRLAAELTRRHLAAHSFVALEPGDVWQVAP